jgi:hypothetical protein
MHCLRGVVILLIMENKRLEELDMLRKWYKAGIKKGKTTEE